MKTPYPFIALITFIILMSIWVREDNDYKVKIDKLSAQLDSTQTQLNNCVALIALTKGQLCRSSFYGDHHQGRRTASGIPFDKNLPMCASWDYPLGTIISVTNLLNGKMTYGMVLDRGPLVPEDPLRKLDVSEIMAQNLDMVSTGVVPVLVKKCNTTLKGNISLNDIYYKDVRKAVKTYWKS